MILSPRKSVTRFFIPLIDVLILLFCIFLLMPFVSNPESADPEPDTKAAEVPLPKDVQALQTVVKDLTAQLKEEQRRVSELERRINSKLTDRLAVRVLEIDPKDGTLFYYDPGREEIKSDADAERLILKQKAATGGKDIYFLILYPRKSGAYPTAAQREQVRQWFKSVPFGEDFP